MTNERMGVSVFNCNKNTRLMAFVEIEIIRFDRKSYELHKNTDLSAVI